MNNFTKSGTLGGAETKEVIEFFVDLPAIINYTVTVKGGGNNELRVRASQKMLVVWFNIHDFKVLSGEHHARSFSTNLDGTHPLTDHKQAVHIKLTRTDTSEPIDWKVDWTIS